MGERDDSLRHVQPFIDGRIITEIVHGRVVLSIEMRGSRGRLTVPLGLDAADSFFARGAEIVRHGRAQPREAF